MQKGDTDERRRGRKSKGQMYRIGEEGREGRANTERVGKVGGEYREKQNESQEKGIQSGKAGKGTDRRKERER